MITEMELALTWLYRTLSGDATLAGYAPGGISRSFAQPATTTPYVIIKHQASTDAPIFGGSRAYADMRFEVVAVGATKSMQTILNAASRIDTLLKVVQVSVTGGTILASFRDQSISDDSLVDGEVWNSTGGIYRIMAKSS